MTENLAESLNLSVSEPNCLDVSSFANKRKNSVNTSLSIREQISGTTALETDRKCISIPFTAGKLLTMNIRALGIMLLQNIEKLTINCIAKQKAPQVLLGVEYFTVFKRRTYKGTMWTYNN